MSKRALFASCFIDMMKSYLQYLCVAAFLATASTAYPVRRWTYAGSEASTNYDFGKAFGLEFKREIKQRLAKDDHLKKMIQKFGGDSADPTYSLFLRNHVEKYAKYVSELQGIADGAELPFETLFIDQLSEEFTYFMEDKKFVDHCSDVVYYKNEKEMYMAHNEDSAQMDVNGTVFVEAINGVAGGPGFTTFVYMGNTPTGAFGFNTEGIVMTLNYLGPKQPDRNGYGRVFIARAILDASSFDEAVDVASNTPMISGHNYQLGLINSNRLVNIEVAPFGISSLRTFHPGDPAAFHANMYLRLNVSQRTDPSSIHRLARYNAIVANNPVTDLADMRAIIGDQQDAKEPIYHDERSHANGDQSGGYTLISATVDLMEGVMYLYAQNPKYNKPAFNVTICMKGNAGCVV